MARERHRKSPTGFPDQNRDKRGAAATEVQCCSVVRACWEEGEKKESKAQNQQSKDTGRPPKKLNDQKQKQTHRGGGGEGKQRPAWCAPGEERPGQGGSSRERNPAGVGHTGTQKKERERRGTRRGSQCMQHEMVLGARATGSLAAPWGINTQTGRGAWVGQTLRTLQFGAGQEKGARAREKGRR